MGSFSSEVVTVVWSTGVPGAAEVMPGLGESVAPG
jgi:hypothetical protein